VRAVTLWQPFASLIACGAKRFETRSWCPPKPFGYLVAVHAGKYFPAKLQYTAEWPLMVQALRRDGIKGRAELPKMAILCVCRLTGVLPTETAAHVVSDMDRACGDYTSGRFAWRLDLIHRMDPPVPFRGKRNLWIWDNLQGYPLPESCREAKPAVKHFF